jgi:hypothetical protein
MDGDAGQRLGVCAMGPVAQGHELTWMRVWVWQEHDTKVAVSAGVSGKHLGAEAVAASEKLPFTAKKGWMIQTKLEPGSGQFAKGKPALAMAMALVKDKDGSSSVEHWSQAVTVGERYGHPHG